VNTVQIKKYRFNTFLMLCIIAYGCLLASPSPAASVDDVVKQLQNKYAAVEDIRGNFRQTSHLKDLERIEKYKGEFFVKKPSSLRWKYVEPRDEEVVIRDRDTWIYKKADKQVLKTTLSQGSYSQIPIALLNSLGDLSTDFDMVLLRENVLELKPKRPMGYIQGVLLEIAPGDFPLRKFSVLDTHGNQIIMELENVRINSGLDDALFLFRAPPGVEVIDLGK
jgi:outer membrane lipoprotein carrier protein